MTQPRNFGRRQSDRDREIMLRRQAELRIACAFLSAGVAFLIGTLATIREDVQPGVPFVLALFGFACLLVAGVTFDDA